MTSIHFYFNAGDRLVIACRLAHKALQHGKRVLIHAPQPDMARKIDRLLWTWRATSFVPHCYAGDALAAATPVLIAAGDEPASPGAAACEVLLNLSAECPPHFERHERLLELVSRDDEELHAGRARYAFYRDRGYAIHHHDLAAEGRE